MRSHPVTVPLVIFHQCLFGDTRDSELCHKVTDGINIGQPVTMVAVVYIIVELGTHLNLHLALDHTLTAEKLLFSATVPGASEVTE